MQLRISMIAGLVLALYSLPAAAGSYSAVEVGTTGEQLKNTAVQQDKHYLKDDRALDRRINAVLCDMDELLTKLHALPPELAGSSVVAESTTNELGYL
ncbi:MAG TPA: hypothetical protein ENO21_04095, partial [Firmicutes bacterium]|nr:hypothetical protein [Bacillota bacterium]